MMHLREYQNRPECLADYLPWTALIAPGVVLNKDGSFQRTARFRGPDLESSTEEELVATCARINNALRRFGSGWALYFEAARIPAKEYPASQFTDPAAWLVDQERRGEFEDNNSELFESAYYLTLQVIPPLTDQTRPRTFLLKCPKMIRVYLCKTICIVSSLNRIDAWIFLKHSFRSPNGLMMTER